MAKLRIEGPWPAWAEGIQAGALEDGSGRSARVLIRGLDRDADESSLDALQEEARCLADIRHPGMLRLLHVTSRQGKAAHVYKFFEGVSLGRLLSHQRERQTFLPVKICGELSAAVATALAQAEVSLTESYPGRRLMHRGPAPEDILINDTGRIKVSGIGVHRTGDLMPLPLIGYTAPEGNESNASLVYSTSALVCELFTGRRLLPGSSDDARHNTMVDTALAALRDRPGEPIGEAIEGIVREGLQRVPGDRPTLAELATRLQNAAAELRGPGVRAWAGAAVPAAIAKARAASPLPVDDPPALAALAPPPMTDEVPTVVTGKADADALRKAALAEHAEPTLEQRPETTQDVTVEAAMPLSANPPLYTEHEPTVVERAAPKVSLQAPPLHDGPIIDASRAPAEIEFMAAPTPQDSSSGGMKALIVLAVLLMFAAAGVAVLLAVKPELLPTNPGLRPAEVETEVVEEPTPEPELISEPVAVEPKAPKSSKKTHVHMGVVVVSKRTASCKTDLEIMELVGMADVLDARQWVYENMSQLEGKQWFISPFAHPTAIRIARELVSACNAGIISQGAPFVQE